MSDAAILTRHIAWDQSLDEINVHVGKRLQRRRSIVGLTLMLLAEKCGMRFQHLQRQETGANRIYAARLWQLSKQLEVPISYFFEGLDHPSAPSVEDPAALKEVERLTAAFLRLDEASRRHLIAIAEDLGERAAA